MSDRSGPGRGAILLLSGLPLNGRSSFYHQLLLLAAALEAEGWWPWIGGPELSAPSRGLSAPSRGLTAMPARDAAGPWIGAAGPWTGTAGPGTAARQADTLPGLARETGAGAVILLGYPDQFPLPAGWNEGFRLPVFLWAQVSRPPRSPWPPGLTAVPLTEATRRHLRSAGVPVAASVIPHGTEVRLFRPPTPRERVESRALHGVEDRFVVGTVAANTPRKRLDLVIDSFALFQREAQRSAAAGAGERRKPFLLIKTNRRISADGQDLEARLRRQVPATAAALLTEDLPLTRLPRLYWAMDVYLNLSEWEGFGLPVLEAMSCGLPIIRPPIQGPGEIVPYPELVARGNWIDEEGGTRLFQPVPEEAAALLRQVYDRPEMRERLGRRGRGEAVRRYDIRSIARRWSRLIEAGSFPPPGPREPLP